MGKWECYRCSYVSEAENPPEECPSCHYSVTFWLERVEEKKELTVKDFMRTRLLKLDSGRSVLDAARIMRENDAGSVLVTVDGEHVGIVTERDVLYKVAAKDLRSSGVPLREVMTPAAFSVGSGTSIREALLLMAKHHVRRLLVTEDGKPIGMVSQRSILGGSFRLTGDTEEDREND
ncbi:MAG: CBS domain-containing protein [Nitrososphaerales archaeon]|jgi:CBS domain-containing protein